MSTNLPSLLQRLRSGRVRILWLVLGALLLVSALPIGLYHRQVLNLSKEKLIDTERVQQADLTRSLRKSSCSRLTRAGSSTASARALPSPASSTTSKTLSPSLKSHAFSKPSWTPTAKPSSISPPSAKPARALAPPKEISAPSKTHSSPKHFSALS